MKSILININNIYIFIYFLLKVQTDFLDNDFVPSLESNAVTDPFLSVHPKTLVKTAPNVPIIIGINDMEGLIGLGGKLLFYLNYYQIK